LTDAPILSKTAGIEGGSNTGEPAGSNPISSGTSCFRGPDSAFGAGETARTNGISDVCPPRQIAAATVSNRHRLFRIQLAKHSRGGLRSLRLWRLKDVKRQLERGDFCCFLRFRRPVVRAVERVDRALCESTKSFR